MVNMKKLINVLNFMDQPLKRFNFTTKGETGTGKSVTPIVPKLTDVTDHKSVDPGEIGEQKNIGQRVVKPGIVSDRSFLPKEEEVIKMIEALRPGKTTKKGDKDKIIKAVLDEDLPTFEVIKKVMEIDRDLSDIDKSDLENLILSFLIPLKSLTGDDYQRGKSKDWLKELKNGRCSLFVRLFFARGNKEDSIFQTMKKINGEIAGHQAYEIIAEAQQENLSVYDVIEKTLKLSEPYNDVDVNANDLILPVSKRLDAIKGGEAIDLMCSESSTKLLNIAKADRFMDFLEMDAALLRSRQKEREIKESIKDQEDQAVRSREAKHAKLRLVLEQIIKPVKSAYTWMEGKCASAKHIKLPENLGDRSKRESKPAHLNALLITIINDAEKRFINMSGNKEAKPLSFLEKLAKDKCIDDRFIDIFINSCINGQEKMGPADQVWIGNRYVEFFTDSETEKKYEKIRAGLEGISLYEFFKGTVVLENPGQDFFSCDKKRELLDYMIVNKYNALERLLNSCSRINKSCEKARDSAPVGKLSWASMTHAQCEEHLQIIKKIEDELISCVGVDRAYDVSGGLTRFLRPEQFTRLHDLLSEWKKVEPVDQDIPVRHQLEVALSPEKRLIKLNVLRKLFPIRETGTVKELMVNGKKRNKTVSTYEGILSRQVAAVLQSLPEGEEGVSKLRMFANKRFSEILPCSENSQKPDGSGDDSAGRR